MEERLFKRPFSSPTAPRTRQPRGGTERSKRLSLSLDAVRDLFGVHGPAKNRLSGRCPRVTPCPRASSIGFKSPRTQPTPADPVAGSPEWAQLGSLRPLAAPGQGQAHGAGALACRPRCARIFWITGCLRIAALIFSSPPQFGQCSTSISKTRLGNLAQFRRTGRWCARFASHSAGFCCLRGRYRPLRHPRGRSVALGASTPWNLIRCSRGRGTSAASRCMNSSGLRTLQAAPSQGLGPSAGANTPRDSLRPDSAPGGWRRRATVS